MGTRRAWIKGGDEEITLKTDKEASIQSTAA